MFEAMLHGWRAQQAARGLREDTIEARERLMRRFSEFTNPKNSQRSWVVACR
jgi:integrase/recombinase XerC